MSLHMLGAVEGEVKLDPVAETVDDVRFPRQGAPSFHAAPLEVDDQPDTRLALRRHYPDLRELENFPRDPAAAEERDIEAARWAGFGEGEEVESLDLLGRPWWQPGLDSGAVGGGGHHHCPAPVVQQIPVPQYVAPWGGYGPWYNAGPQFEIDDEPDVDPNEFVAAVADAVAERIASRGPSRGAVGGLAEYSWGEKQVEELVQYHDALGRPREFEAAVQAVYAAYEKTKTSFATLAGLVRDEKMRQIGIDAAALMKKIQAAQAAKGGGSATVPSESDPPPPPSDTLGGLKRYLPWVVGGAVVIGVGVVAAPLVLPLIAAALARRGAGRIASGALR